jgi:hypothetical protein
MVMDQINELATGLVVFGTAVIVLCGLFGWRKGF